MTHSVIDKRASRMEEEIQGMSPVEVLRKRGQFARALAVSEALAALDNRAPEGRPSLTRREREKLAGRRKARKLARKARRAGR